MEIGNFSITYLDYLTFYFKFLNANVFIKLINGV